MSKMFDYISGKDQGKVAELEAREEYALGKLGVEIEENEKLLARIAELEAENNLLKDRLWTLSNPARYAAGMRRERE